MFFKYTPVINDTKHTAMIKKTDGTFKRVASYIWLDPDAFNVLEDSDGTSYTTFQANSVDVNVYNYGEYVPQLKLISLSWDGDITGREVLPGTPAAYKISDDLFTSVSDYKVYANMNNVEVDITDSVTFQQGSISSLSDLYGFFHSGYSIGVWSVGPISAATYGVNPGIYFDKYSSYRYICKFEATIN